MQETFDIALAENAADVRSAFAVMRALRPHLVGEADLVTAPGTPQPRPR